MARRRDYKSMAVGQKNQAADREGSPLSHAVQGEPVLCPEQKTISQSEKSVCAHSANVEQHICACKVLKDATRVHKLGLSSRCCTLGLP